MNTTEIKSENLTYGIKRKFSPGSALCGLVVGLGLAGAFWAGHEMWPQNAGKAPDITTAPHVAGPLAGAIKKPGGTVGTNFIADIVAEASPSVVNIDTSTSISIPGFSIPRNLGLGLGDIFGEGEQTPIRKYESHGSGSGVVIRSDGYILTNNHVVQNADDIKVTLSDGRSFTGKVIGKDRFTDIALVKIPATGLRAAKIGSSKNLRPGDWAVAIGSPLGFSESATLGIISALGRSLGDINAGVDLIQTDAAINPGNSGGPLLNINGEVIGINQAVSRTGQNISFAIPIDIANSVASQLMAKGTIHHPFLGISMADIDDRVAKTLNVPANTKGVAIASVQTASPAQKSGLMPGDIIQKINGKPVTSARDLQAVVRAHRPGEKLEMTVLRQQMDVLIPVRIGDYEDMKPQKDEQQQP